MIVGLPAPVTSQIREDVKLQLLQKQYFETRPKLGPEVVPVVYQPIFETERGWLRAIFVAPGENHLIFIDEIAPIKAWDEYYRAHRIQSLGRAADIESIEISDNKVYFRWSYSFANLYETSFHFDGKQDWTGILYSSTWNHMLNTRPQVPILLRGGYRRMEPEIYYGDRDAAEEYAKRL
ncbi:hypothetical protein LCGC14_0263100 [marine sediment metagenome]|uniref:Uncharacterized protein n=1 Tax=marine sediment metagenome TaxID=412755 RepID=A0A0F9U1C3_9ZZZZ